MTTVHATGRRPSPTCSTARRRARAPCKERIPACRPPITTSRCAASIGRRKHSPTSLELHSSGLTRGAARAALCALHRSALLPPRAPAGRRPFGLAAPPAHLAASGGHPHVLRRVPAGDRLAGQPLLAHVAPGPLARMA